MKATKISEVIKYKFDTDLNYKLAYIGSFKDEIFNQFSNYIKIKELDSDNTLCIEVNNSSVLQDLVMQKQRILKKMNEVIFERINKKTSIKKVIISIEIKNIIFKLK